MDDAKTTQSNPIWKHVLTACAIAVALYVIAFWGCQTIRIHRGPWEVTFRPETAKGPAIVINQPHLGISNLMIVFRNEKPPPLEGPKTVAFNKPTKSIPFGEWIFDDLMYLPGTVTLQMFDHEIELLPRTLIVDRKEIPWESDKTIVLEPRQEPPPAPQKTLESGNSASSEN